MKWKLKITTLTPVHIGSGEVYSPYTDYILDNGFVNLIDKSKLDTLFIEKPELINIFISGIKSDFNNRNDKYTLNKMFKKFNIDYKKYINKKLQVTGDIRNTEIKRFVQSAGKPFIPGSSLKGAIRTAIVFYLIENNYNNSLNIIKQNINKLSNNSEKNLVNSIKSIDNQLLIIDDRVKKIKENFMSYIRITDSDFCNDNNLVINLCKRYSLKKKTSAIPIVLESLKEKTTTNSTFTFKIPFKNNMKFPLIESEEHSIQKIFEMINNFSLKFIDNEFEFLDKYENDDLNIIYNFYNDLENDIEDSNNKCAYLRIGQGKTVFDNTILTLFDNEQFKKIYNAKTDDRNFSKNAFQLKKVARGREISNVDFFPSTRTTTTRKELPENVLGWIKIEVE